MKQLTDLTKIFANNTPLIDTRSPIEFKQGAFPNAKNIPLLTDKQRALVGACYKQSGRIAALNLGHSIIQGKAKQKFINSLGKFIKKHPNGALYCYRGGMRSEITQKWIYEELDISYPRIMGGYKAMRRFLIDETDRIIQKTKVVVIGGQTGCGKTLLLNQIKSSIDLEALANHRGSAFGSTTSKQPTQINFENNLAIEFIKKQNFEYLFFEDEGSNIGFNHIPKSVQDKTSRADLILLETSIQQRLKISMDAYVVNMLNNFKIKNKEDGFTDFSNYWLTSLEKIQKRLGGQRYKKTNSMLKDALSFYKTSNSLDKFRPIVKSLLFEYYDPMYNYQIKQKHHRVIFSGTDDEILVYIERFI